MPYRSAQARKDLIEDELGAMDDGLLISDRMRSKFLTAHWVAILRAPPDSKPLLPDLKHW
jgi:hypothetical protein